MLRLGKLEVSGGFLLTAAVLYYLDDQGIFLWALLACALHEWGHYAIIRLLGGQVTYLRLTAVGGEMHLASSHMLSYGRELAAVLAGPAVNLGTALLILRVAKEGGEVIWLFAGLNIVIGCFNLLPAYPLDGGRALRLLISILWSPESAERMERVVTLMTELALLGAGTALLWKTRQNFTLIVTAIWIFAGTLHPKSDIRSI